MTHGSFTLTHSGLVASMGEMPLAVLDPVTGERREQYDLKLDGNHMPEFAIASTVARMYAVGSCGYTGGLAVVDLATKKTEVIAESRRTGGVCGEGIVAPNDGSVLRHRQNRASVPSGRPVRSHCLAGRQGASNIPTSASDRLMCSDFRGVSPAGLGAGGKALDPEDHARFSASSTLDLDLACSRHHIERL